MTAIIDISLLQLSGSLSDTQQELAHTKHQLLEATTVREQLQLLVVGMQGEAEAAAECSERESAELLRASSLIEELREQVSKLSDLTLSALPSALP